MTSGPSVIWLWICECHFFPCIITMKVTGFSLRFLVAGERCNVTTRIFWKRLLIWVKNSHKLPNVSRGIFIVDKEFSDLWCLMNTLKSTLNETGIEQQKWLNLHLSAVKPTCNVILLQPLSLKIHIQFLQTDLHIFPRLLFYW